MKIVALGDAHLGRSVTTATNEEGVNAREADFETTFLRSVSSALDQKPDVFLWLGDIFDHPRPNYRSFRVAVAALSAIRAHGCPLVAISGNHDTPRLPGVGNPYAVLSDLFPEFNFAFKMQYEAIDLNGLRVHCVPQTKTSKDALDCLASADKNRSLDKTNLLITHPLVHSVERKYADMNEIEIHDSALASDLVLLGHYHTYQQIDGRSNVWYAGSTDTFTFADDPSFPKGYVSLDTQSGHIQHVSVLPQRKLITGDSISGWDLSATEIGEQLCNTLSKCDPGSVVRIFINDIDGDVYRLLPFDAINEAAKNLLHFKLHPTFRNATNEVQDLPELLELSTRWKSYVETQQVEGFDLETLVSTGEEYLQAAIEASNEG